MSVLTHCIFDYIVRMKILHFPKKTISPQEFEQLLKPYIEHLYRIAFRFCNDRDNAEDLVQDVLIKLYTGKTNLLEIEDLRPWLARVLYNQFVDNKRRSARSPVQSIEDMPDQSEPAAGANTRPDQVLEKVQKLEKLQQAFGRLSEEHRIVTTLHDVEGYSLKDMQGILDLPMGTLKSRLHRARAQLKEFLNKQ